MHPPMLALLLAAVVTLPAPRARAAQLHDPLDCPSAAQVEAAMARRVPGLPGAVTLQHPKAGTLEVLWQVEGRRFTRQLPLAPSECTAAAQTVALLLEAWRRALPTTPADDPLAVAAQVTQRPHRAVADAGTPDAGPPPTPAAPEPDAGSVAIAIIDPAPIDAGPPPPVVIRAEAPATFADAGVEEPPIFDELPIHLELALSGRGAVGVDAPQSVAGGTVALAFGLGEQELAADLQLGVDAPLHGAAGPGTALARRQTLAARAALRTRPWSSQPALGLRLAGGLLLERIAARSQGYTVDVADTVFNPGLSLAAALELRLAPFLSLELGPDVQLLLHPTRFQVTGVGTVLRLPALWVGGTGGLRFDFL
jgi:hypothetical protein